MPETKDKNTLESWQADRLEWYENARKERHRMLSWLGNDEQRWKDIKFVCKKDTIKFINYFCWAYDPRNLEIGYPTTVPFWLTPHQEDYVRFLEDHMSQGENGLTEKTRGEGMSFIWVLFSLKHLLFDDGFKAGFGTYNENKLDQIGNMDSLFEKFRFAFYRLEPYFQPKGFNASIHDNFKRFYNPETKSAITGEVGKNIGRGGRNTIYFVDEHAHLQHAKNAEKSLSENTNCIQYGSTPHGTDNVFYDKRQKMDKKDIFTFHWRSNPMKNQDWYDDRCRRFDEVTIAQEIDIDYTASVEGIVIPAKWVQTAIDLQLNEFTYTNIREAGVDIGQGKSKGESVYAERIGSTLMPLDCKSTVEPTDWIIHCAKKALASNAQQLKYDAVGVGGPMGGTLKRVKWDKPLKSIPVIAGASPSDKKYDDNPELTAKDRFKNLRAEMWWNLRERFRKTYQYVKKGEPFPEDELISIPQDSTLITQLSQPTMEYTTSGKIKIESKEDMASRGIASPDRADAVVMAYADLKPKMITIPAGSQ